jgi:WD40 repeat protein
MFRFGLLVVMVLCALVTGCQPNGGLATPVLQRETLKLPPAWYGSPAWVADDLLAFVQRPDNSPFPFDDQLIAFRPSTSELQTIDLPPKPPQCFKYWPRGPLKQLPDGRLGYLVECSLVEPGFERFLYAWEPGSNQSSLLLAGGDDFKLDGYAFSPDMQQQVLHHAVGTLLNDELYARSAAGEVEQLVPDFQRAMLPDWSPDGTQILFWGTDTYSGGASSSFTTTTQIAGLATAPWDLYAMQANGSNPRILIERVRSPLMAKWSPDGQRFAFSGNYEQVVGLWLVDPATAAPALIVSGRIVWDWSPDGTQIVMVELGEGPYSVPAIIDVPVLDDSKR